ncbi:UNVERIFIED_ORG: hypothetical protein M2442_001395 [Methylorubrum zatmanii]|nr:hypothetical protein [Methylorubrum pseudosasae]MDH6665396.1 hypothetical protein [Methylorubrum zatmanii]
MAVVATLEDHARGLPDLESKFRRDDDVGPSTDAVGSEVFAQRRFSALGVVRTD